MCHMSISVYSAQIADFGVFWRPQNAHFCTYMTKSGGQFALASPAPNTGGTCPPCPLRDLRPWLLETDKWYLSGSDSYSAGNNVAVSRANVLLSNKSSLELKYLLISERCACLASPGVDCVHLLAYTYHYTYTHRHVAHTCTCTLGGSVV